MYLLDANTMMEAGRLYYGFDIAPGYWDWLIRMHEAENIASVEAVLDEISGGDDPLVGWSQQPALDGFWLPDSAESLVHSAELARWANDPERIYKQAAVDEFMASPDLRLIAQARALDGTVVTREVSAPGAKNKVKIPDVCGAFDISCVQPFEVYRTLGMTLT